MRPDEIHAWIAKRWEEQSRAPYETAPSGETQSAWRNRHLIHARLKPATHHQLMTYCREKGFSCNSAVNLILSNFFHIIDND